MSSDTNSSSPSTTNVVKHTLSPAAIAARGQEITGLDILLPTAEVIDPSRVVDLMADMHADVPTGGTDYTYGEKDTQYLRYWKPSLTSKPPIIIYIHGGSWRAGTYLDSIGSAKVSHLTNQGYAFATVNFSLLPSVTVEEQVQEVADAIGYLVRNAENLAFDAEKVILMGHSSGAHVAALLGTDASYLGHAGIPISTVRGVVALDGSNYNAFAEITDSPGPIAENQTFALGTDPKRLNRVSPTYHARAPNAGAFLFLHVQRRSGVRQAVEFVAALEAAGTEAELRVFEGEWFEGHVGLLLNIGKTEYPATGLGLFWQKVQVLWH
ncbi:Alpha/Beta hydrolase protein [Aspergillus karnatakaensis]|uniref:alpha/beta hydrolase n=1 Tax=Aspergillus karnatakaensis TaxID=1810916 RepID=UPI003CCE36BA